MTNDEYGMAEAPLAEALPGHGLSTLAPADRPREKLLRAGAAALGDNELVAVLLGSGLPKHDALAVAAQLLAAVGGLASLGRAPVERLTRAPGVGATRAARPARRRGARPPRPRRSPAAAAPTLVAGGGGRLPAARSWRPPGRTVRRAAARHAASRHSRRRHLARDARRESGASARGVPRRHGTCGRRARALPQPPIGRPVAQRRRTSS